MIQNSIFHNVAVLSCTILCSTAFCRLSNDSQRRITQRLDVDGAAYRLHGQKLAGIAFNHVWNNVGETASAAAAGNRFHSGMVRATNDPWSCAVTAPMARNLKLWFAFVRPSAAAIPSSSADTAVLLWVMLYIRLSLLSLRLASKFIHPRVFSILCRASPPPVIPINKSSSFTLDCLKRITVFNHYSAKSRSTGTALDDA